MGRHFEPARDAPSVQHAIVEVAMRTKVILLGAKVVRRQEFSGVEEIALRLQLDEFSLAVTTLIFADLLGGRLSHRNTPCGLS